VTISFGGLNVFSPITSIQIPNNQLAQVLGEYCFKNSLLLQNKKLRKNQ
jgi:hypothetical protein